MLNMASNQNEAAGILLPFLLFDHRILKDGSYPVAITEYIDCTIRIIGYKRARKNHCRMEEKTAT
ncbi:hypothetical protein DBR32_14095 [Taibaiella sp. KBW10]|uniref:hypothetical protein n=1 Tax=Taibaiella sp. KBW10 TaxID=2153357 RepID=UPI000F5B106C|nr:hypothetical protein [Taibaiella sp. KBW10]RQO29715.1 hypothetical protein DBR32_14095 [Taibaiella sp. KBW10]